jgi:hypothetical protein
VGKSQDTTACTTCKHGNTIMNTAAEVGDTPAPNCEIASTARRSVRNRRHGSATTTLQDRRVAALFCLEGAALLGSCLLVWWLSAVLVNAAWSWLALVQFVWLCVYCFRLEPQGFSILLPIVITRASGVVALIAIEYGARLPEVGLSGTPGPHTTSYVFFTGLLFASYLAAFHVLHRLLRTSEARGLTKIFDRYAAPISAIVVVIVTGATLWLFAIGASRGFPLLVNMDRFVFRRVYADNLTLNILNCKALLAGALGLVTFCMPVSQPLRRISSVTCLVFIFINFLFGDKFFIILSTVASFFIPYLYVHHRTATQKFGLLVMASALLMVPVMGVTWFIYSDQGRASVEATTQRLTERFAAQGQLWYLQNKIGAPATKWDREFINRNYGAMFVKKVDLFALQNGLGPAYFMNLYSPAKIRAAQGRNAGSVTYTMALEPLLLANFGWIGLCTGLIACGWLLALGALYVAYAIKRRLILSMVFSGYIMLLLRSFATQGTPWVVASIFTLKWLSVVLGVELSLMLLAVSQNGSRLRKQPSFRLDRLSRP